MVKRYRDLGRARSQVACRLHAVLCALVAGGFSREITARQAAGVLQRIDPSDAIELARCELAAEFLADPRRLDGQIRGTRHKLAAAVAASGTTLTGIFGVGPVIAAVIIGTAGQVSRFGDRDRFAACNGTAPIEVSSGDRKIHRLSLRGNRRLNHAIHMAAVTQIGTSTAPAAPTSTARSPRARPARKRSARSSASSATPSTPGSPPAPPAAHP